MQIEGKLATTLPFLPLKQRNAALDNLFYDTPSLKPAEMRQLTPLIDIKGSIVVVPPGSSNQPIRHYERALRFMNKEGDNIRAIAIAGVGSSVIGTAALARNVADALACDVAGIVTGYGMSDVITEALGGWFVFGTLDRLRLDLEKFVGKATSPLSELERPDSSHAMSATGILEPRLVGQPGFDDVTTLVDILTARPKNLELLVGHSKGSLLIDFVLDQFVDELEGDDSPLFEQLDVITMGAVVDISRKFRKVKQYLGAIDWFGGLNSELGLPHQLVPNAWHHLNRSIPRHMDAVSLMQRFRAA
jgi:hypothetical protein